MDTLEYQVPQLKGNIAREAPHLMSPCKGGHETFQCEDRLINVLTEYKGI